MVDMLERNRHSSDLLLRLALWIVSDSPLQISQMLSQTVACRCTARPLSPGTCYQHYTHDRSCDCTHKSHDRNLPDGVLSSVKFSRLFIVRNSILVILEFIFINICHVGVVPGSKTKPTLIKKIVGSI